MSAPRGLYRQPTAETVLPATTQAWSSTGETPTGRERSSVVFTSKAIFLPATRRRCVNLARFILANCQAATPDERLEGAVASTKGTLSDA